MPDHITDLHIKFDILLVRMKSYLSGLEVEVTLDDVSQLEQAINEYLSANPKGIPRHDPTAILFINTVQRFLLTCQDDTLIISFLHLLYKLKNKNPAILQSIYNLHHGKLLSVIAARILLDLNIDLSINPNIEGLTHIRNAPNEHVAKTRSYILLEQNPDIDLAIDLLIGLLEEDLPPHVRIAITKVIIEQSDSETRIELTPEAIEAIAISPDEEKALLLCNQLISHNYRDGDFFFSYVALALLLVGKKDLPLHVQKAIARAVIQNADLLIASGLDGSSIDICLAVLAYVKRMYSQQNKES